MSIGTTPNGVGSRESYDERVARLRDSSEFHHLKENTFLDHAENTPCPQSLIDLVTGELKADLFGQFQLPAPSRVTAIRIDGIRRAVLDCFKANPAYFDVVFVANATAAIKLVMHSFQEHRFRFTYHKDAHTSLVGVREVARAGSRCLDSDLMVEDWLENGDSSDKDLAHDGLRLFAYPAQSNLTGHRLPLMWSQRLRESRLKSHRKTYILLDASSYLTTGSLDLRDPKAAPDFISVSFQKMYGYPELGALIVRKEAGRVLTQRRYFGGGTVSMVIDVDEQWHAKKESSIHESLEDGALPAHSIFALEHAIKVHRKLFAKPDVHSQYLSRLSTWLDEDLISMRHFTGVSVVQVYKESNSMYSDHTTQGPIIAFNLRDSQGSWVSKSQFQKLAMACNIQVAAGDDFENPGGIATMLNLRPWEMIRNFYECLKYGDDLDVVGNTPTGMLRVSLGLMSTTQDVATLASFIRFFFIQNKAWQPKSPRGLVEFFDSDLSEQAEDYFNEAQVATGKTTPLAIEPIEGCNIFHFPQIHETHEATEAAYSLWDHQWCLVDKATGLAIVSETHELDHLQISVIPERGILKVTATRNFNNSSQVPAAQASSSKHDPGEATGAESSHRNVTRGNTLKIDLWTPPPEQAHAFSAQDGRIADTYPQPEIASFFTQAVGSPCTLARYRTRKDIMEKRRRTCVIPKCRLNCADEIALDKHYKMHAEEFERENKKLTREKSDRKRPPHLQLSPSTEGETNGLGRSNSKALFRSNSKKVPLTPGPVPTPYSPIDTEPKRRSVDFLRIEPASKPRPLTASQVSTASRPLSRSGSKKIFRSGSKRHASNPAAAIDSTVEELPKRKSLDWLTTARPGHERAKNLSENIMTTPLISVEDADEDFKDKAPLEKKSWIGRHLSVRSTRSGKGAVNS